DDVAERIAARPARSPLVREARVERLVLVARAGAAALDGCGAREEPLGVAPAEEARAQAGRLVDRDPLEPGRKLKVLAAVGSERADQEPPEDRQRRLGAGQAERRAVVEADPDRRDELGGEAHEPRIARVVGGAGLAGHGTAVAEV